MNKLKVSGVHINFTCSIPKFSLKSWVPSPLFLKIFPPAPFGFPDPQNFFQVPSPFWNFQNLGSPPFERGEHTMKTDQAMTMDGPWAEEPWTDRTWMDGPWTDRGDYMGPLRINMRPIIWWIFNSRENVWVLPSLDLTKKTVQMYIFVLTKSL